MNRIIAVLIVIMSLPFNPVLSQPGFPDGKSVADSLREEGDLTGAIEEYRKAYILNRENRNNLYNFACALSLDRQIDSSFRYFNLAMQMDTSSATLVDPDFLPARADKQWEVFENMLMWRDRKSICQC